MEKYLGENPELKVYKDCDMSAYTTFKVGGKAKYAVEVEDEEELKKLLQFLTSNNIKHMLLGNGSNTIFSDEGYDGVVIMFSSEGDFGRIEINGTTAAAGAAVLMSTFARALASDDLAGFEALSGIPGSIGGACFMNAGAYGTEMKDLVKSVHVVTPDGKESKIVEAKDLDMGYRHSALMENGYIVTEVIFELTSGNQAEIVANMKDFAEKRNSKQPIQYPSAGSFFKRPEGYFAGKLIEDAGLKGLTVGGAQVSQLHAGFIINIGGATSKDIVQLMHLIQNTVYDKFGVMLEPEVRII